MRAKLILLSLALVIAKPALAHHRHNHKQHHHKHHYHHRVAHLPEGYLGGNVARARAHGLPWCGAWLADHFGIGGPLGRSLWVARNWARWGRAAGGPAVGAVVVFIHHVGHIVGGPDAHGRWLIESGNDSHAVRTRYRSLRGAIAFREAI